MSAEILAALKSKAPVADGTNNTGELRFTTGASQSNALPKTPQQDWRGRWVDIKNESVVAGEFVAFHFSVGAGVTAAIAAAAAGGAPAVDRGRFIAPGERLRVRVPVATAQGADVFFNRVAGAGTPIISMSLVE